MLIKYEITNAKNLIMAERVKKMAIKENDFINILKLIAPGTPIREGLENILKAKKGSLIVIGENKEVMD